MQRTSTSVILRKVETGSNGETSTTFYGPFLPHAGSAVQHGIGNLYSEAELRGARAVDVYIETVFIGAEESDCTVVATR